MNAMDATNGVLDKTDYRLSHRRVPPIQPRIIIHGGAGNISRATITPEKRAAYRKALKEIVRFPRLFIVI